MCYWRIFTQGNKISLLDFMENYVRLGNCNKFTFTSDYFAFYYNNRIYNRIYKNSFVDENKYDEMVREHNEKISAISKSYYVIVGCKDTSSNTFNHEVAHFLYETNKAYKESCNNIISEMPDNIRKLFIKSLKAAGYHGNKEYLWSELQAYLSTDFDIICEVEPDIIKQYSVLFEKNIEPLLLLG